METNDDNDIIEPTTQNMPKISDNGHDNNVFADERGRSHLSRPSLNTYHSNDQPPPQSFRMIENSRL